MVDRGKEDACHKSNIRGMCSIARWSRTGSAPFFVFVSSFFRWTRAVVDGDLVVGGKVKRAGFPGPRGGPGTGAPATSARSYPVEMREMTDVEVARQACLKFRVPRISGGGALIGREEMPASR